MTEPDRFPVVVIGGGLAGLTAAVHLAERGIPPLVLEADSAYAGGRLQGGAPESFEHQGRVWSFASEHGMHALWGNYDNMRAMLDRFAPLEARRSEGEDWLYRRGREVRRAEAGSAVRKTWLPAPLHYFQLLLLPRFWAGISFLDIGAFPGFAVSLLLTLAVDPLMEEIRWDGLDLNDYFLGWTPNLRATFIGLARNLLAQPAETISLTAMIAAARFYTTLRRDSWSVDYLPDNSHRCLVEPLTEYITQREGMLMLGIRATRLDKDANGWRVSVDDAKRGSRSISAQRVILALDPVNASKLLNASPDTASPAQSMRFPDGLPCAAIRLWFDRQPDRQRMPGGMMTGDFALDNFFWLERLRPDFAEWRTATSGGCLEMHLYATHDAFRQSDADLIALAAGEAHRAWPELKGHMLHGAVRRNEASQPRFTVPRRDDSLFVESPWEGISACGDWIGYPSPSMNMERSVITGIAAANAVIAAHDGAFFPILPPRKPEALASLIGGVGRLLRKVIGPLAWRIAKRNKSRRTPRGR